MNHIVHACMVKDIKYDIPVFHEGHKGHEGYEDISAYLHFSCNFLHFSEFIMHFSAFLCISLHSFISICICRQHYSLLFTFISIITIITLITIIHYYSSLFTIITIII